MGTAYFPALDGLRTICFAWVVVGHAYVGHPVHAFTTRMSTLGVQIFFALSGFLITTLLLRELSANGRVDLLAFYTRRALRIFPVYYSAAFLAFGGMLLLGDRFSHPFGVNVSELDLPLLGVTHGLFVANWFRVPMPTVLEVLWSVSVEEQFYLFFPITFAASRRARAALGPIGVGLLVALVVRFFIVRRGDLDSIHLNTFATGDHFLLGALAAQLVHTDREKVTTWVRRCGTLGEILAFGVVASLCAWDRRQPWEWYVEASLSAAAAASIVLMIAIGDGRIARLLAVRWMRKAGQLTYAAYVFHIYGLALSWKIAGKLRLGIEWAAPLRAILGVVLALLIALAVRVAFEGRILAWKQRFERVK